jgi:hypothetical protein
LWCFQSDVLRAEAENYDPNSMQRSDVAFERFRLSPDGGTLWLTQLYEDPDTFEGLAARYVAFTREPGGYIYPFECFAGYLAP